MTRPSPKNKQAESWIKTSQMCAYLCVSSKVLRRMIDDGTLHYAVHYIDIREKSSTLPVYRFNKQACLELFSTPPENR